MITIKVDDRELRRFTDAVKGGAVERAMNTAIHKTGAKIKHIVREDADKYYEGGKNWIGSAVQSPQNGFMSCIVPIKGSRGGIGERFATGGSAYNTNQGGAYGFVKGGAWKKLRGKKAAKVRAKILKGKASQLPDTIPHQGGNPPFLYGGVAYTRRTRQKRPIVHVVGVAVPQMVTNKARPDIEKDIVKELEKNIVAEVEKALT